ncbi:MAG: RimK/LysX family protein [Candidatus Aenigmatarchaeota archaeon]
MKKIVGLVEQVKVIGERSKKVLAKFDTGAKWSSIDKRLAREIKPKTRKIKKIKSTLGKEKRRLVELKIIICGRKFETKATVADRSKSPYPVLIGRNVIFRNFIIDVEKSNLSPRERDLRKRWI